MAELNEEIFERAQGSGVMLTTRLLGAVAQDVRLTVLTLLTAGGSQSVSELAAVSGVTMPTVSHHLQILARAGLVQSAREGREVLYRVTPHVRVVTADKRYLGGWQFGDMHLLMCDPSWSAEPDPAPTAKPRPKTRAKRKGK